MPTPHRLPLLMITLGALTSCQGSHATPTPGSGTASEISRTTPAPAERAPAAPESAAPTSTAPAAPTRAPSTVASSSTPSDTAHGLAPDALVQATTLEQRFLLHFLPARENDRRALEARVQTHLSTADGHGRFRDISYQPHLGNGDSTGWGEHLLRVVDLAMAWRMDGGAFRQDPRLPPLIRAGMDAYVATPYNFQDQWGYGHPYGDLMETKRLGIVCLCAHGSPDTFPQADIERWADRIPPFIETYSGNFLEGGANLLWTAWGQIAGALTRADATRRIAQVDGYFRLLWSSMLVRGGRTSIGGCPRLTWDHMLGEHDVPCMGSYGEWYVNDVLVYDDITRGLPRWTMPEPVVRLWIDVLVDGVTFCYQGAVDPHLANPAFWLNARRDGNTVLTTWLSHFEHRNYRTRDVADILAWKPGTGPWPRHDRSIGAFPTIDFMTKHFAHWMWSGRAVSERTLGLETFDQTDLHRAVHSSLLPYGACFLRRSASTLQDLQVGAVWDAYDFGRPSGMTTRHVDPGTLAALWNRDAKGKAVRRNRGSTPFSGMAALPHTGVMAWWQGREVVVDEGHGCPKKTTDILTPGRHAVFVLDHAIVHLAADLDTRHATFPTFTSVEQRLSSAGALRYGLRNGQVVDAPAGTAVTADAIAWVWYDDVLYLPPRHGTTTVQDIVQKGPDGSTSWMANAKGVKSPTRIPAQERRTFSVFTDHGRDEEHLQLQWAIVPDVARGQAETVAAAATWTVLANTPELQALSVPGSTWVGAAFHRPGTLAATATLPALTVDRPLLCAAQRHDDRLEIAVADPLGQAGTVHLSLDGHAVQLTLPDGDHVGGTTTASWRWRDGAWQQDDTP